MWRLTGALVLLLLAVGGAWWLLRSGGREGPYPIPGEGERVVVEVINATGIDGLARAVTGRLRERGIDVVSVWTASSDTLTSTIVYLRRGDLRHAHRVRDALGLGEVRVEEDAALLLDVSVFLGRDAAELIGLEP